MNSDATFASVPLGLRKNERGRAEGEEQDITIDLWCVFCSAVPPEETFVVEQPNDIISCMMCRRTGTSYLLVVPPMSEAWHS